MARKSDQKLEDYPLWHCPECGPESGYMEILMFLGMEPDGYVCPLCRGYFADIDEELKKLALLI
jgi:rubredoxin